MDMKKIYSKKQLLNKISELKSQKKKIVLCHGVFYLVHLGHINHFIAAKKFGDFLIVSITKDQYIKKSIKGTLFNEKQDYYIYQIFEIIDAVVLSDEASSTDIIKLVRPNFYVRGEDYKNNKSDDARNIFRSWLASLVK